MADHFCICPRVRNCAWAKHDPAFHAIDIFYLFGTAADLRDEEDPHTKLAFDYMTYWWVTRGSRCGLLSATSSSLDWAFPA
jgi:hypothetical protein